LKSENHGNVGWKGPSGGQLVQPRFQPGLLAALDEGSAMAFV